jgi:Na+/H+ antiporter NhaD/arsenite permease-like protein
MKQMVFKFSLIFFLIAIIALLSDIAGLNASQILAVSTFTVCILGTLFFWEFRLSFAFLGASILLLTRSLNLRHFIEFSSLEVILFLVGMMILIGLLKETGFFAWVTTLIIRVRGLTARKFLFITCLFSAFLACAVDEVTSIIFMVAAIIELCDYFEVDPIPYLIASIIMTNIGSAGTLLGNPIGILIATKAGLTFEDFMLNAFPLMLVSLFFVIGLFLFIYRHKLKELDKRLKEEGDNEILKKLISVPPEKQLKIALAIFGITLFFIAMHHRLEIILGLEPNTVLLTMPIIGSGLVMIWKRKRARFYIEKDVEWWTLLFFLFLFAQAGTLKYTGATDVFARHIVNFAGQDPARLTGLVLWTSAFGSCMLDNVVLVAAFIPIIQSLISIGVGTKLLWWALLFGGCFGGNITVIGSTANIVALGLLEKEKRLKIGFFQWLKIGMLVGVITIGLVWVWFLFIIYMGR